MADISQIQMPDGTNYNIKDEDARNLIVRSDESIVAGTTKLQIGTSSETVNLVTNAELEAKGYLTSTDEDTIAQDVYNLLMTGEW